MSAKKIAECWKDLLGSECQIDHDADEVIWRLPNCTVYIGSCIYGVHELTISAGGESIFCIKGEPPFLEPIIKGIQK